MGVWRRSRDYRGWGHEHLYSAEVHNPDDDDDDNDDDDDDDDDDDADYDNDPGCENAPESTIKAPENVPNSTSKVPDQPTESIVPDDGSPRQNYVVDVMPSYSANEFMRAMPPDAYLQQPGMLLSIAVI